MSSIRDNGTLFDFSGSYNAYAIGSIVSSSNTVPSLTISAGTNTVLTRDEIYQNVIINGGGSLTTSGYRLYVLNTLTIHTNASVRANGAAASAGTVGSNTVSYISIGVGQNGSNSALANLPCSYGGYGAGGSNTGGGGLTITPTGSQGTFRAFPFLDSGLLVSKKLGTGIGTLSNFFFVYGGGGGQSSSGGGSGGGGAGGNILYINAREIVNGGVLEATGGKGGTNATGGGGGGGGIVVISYITYSGTGSINVKGGGGGTGASGIGYSGSMGTIWRLPELYQNLPETVPNMLAWYKSDRNIVVDTDNTVLSWGDISIYSRSLAQGTAANRPLLVTRACRNTISVVRFDGTNDYLSCSSLSFNKYLPMSQSYTVFTAIKMNSIGSTSTGVIIDGLNTEGGTIGTDNTPRTYLSSGGASALSYGSSLSTSAWTVITAVFSGSNSFLRINGVSQANGTIGTLSPNGITVGALANGTKPASMDMGELIFYSGSVMPEDRYKLEMYLMNRYGVLTGSELL